MKNILLVEDDVFLQDLYKTKLEIGGFKVHTACDAQECLDELDGADVDLIVLDMIMPKHNGLTVLQELQSYPDWRGIPVIVCSSMSPEDMKIDKTVWELFGVVKYLYKPKIKPDGLLKHVNSILSEEDIDE